MPRHRTGTNVLELRGSLKHDAKRYADRETEPKLGKPVGKPPAHLSAAAKKAWRELVAKSHDGMLWESDEPALELAATLLAHVRTVGLGKTPPAMLGRLESLLARFGMTPSDRSRVHVAKPEAPNAFAKFTDASRRDKR